MGKRGAEGMVRCEKCGRLTRRDKAVFIEKIMLSNPLDRKDVHDEQYTRNIYREVAYCPSCGKHGRIYEKKTRMNERNRERDLSGQYGTNRERRFYSTTYAPKPQMPPNPSAAKPAEAPKEAQKAEETKA